MSYAVSLIGLLKDLEKESSMPRWTQEQLVKLIPATDLHVAPFREDGLTTGTLTWVWSVVLSDELYARPYHGPDSRWYKAAMRSRGGRATIAGIDTGVVFEQADAGMVSRIDAAYREKYRGSRYLKAMLELGPQTCTVRIRPAG
jgi:hypothetical protein